jgi:hypothetical protein
MDLEKGLGANEAKDENLNDILAGIVNKAKLPSDV